MPAETSTAVTDEEYDSIFDEGTPGSDDQVPDDTSTSTPVTEEEVPVTETSEVEPKPASGLDLSTLGPIIGESVRSALKKDEVKPEEKPLSPEEVNQLLQVWNPGDDFIERLHNPSTAKDAIIEMRQGLIKQAVTMAKILVSGELAKTKQEVDGRFTEFSQRVDPVLKSAEQSSAKELYSGFTSSYPVFAEDRFKPVLQSVTHQLHSEGYKPKNQGELFDKIAERAEVLLKAANPEFKVTKVQPTKPTTKTTMPRLPSTSRGGTSGGSGQGSSGQPQGPSGVEVFD